MQQLNLHGEHNTEYLVLSYYVNNYISNEVSKNFGRRRTMDLISYLEDTYVDKVYSSFKSENYFEAKWLADMSFRRLRLLDTKPLNNLYDADWKKINRINLLSVVLRYPKFSYVYNEEIKLFLSIVLSDFEIDVKEIRNLPAELETIRNYLISVYMFREKDYDTALFYLANCFGNKNNFYLYNDALLLKARTLFWIYDSSRTDSTYQIFKIELEAIKAEIKVESYLTDINHYLYFADSLHNPRCLPEITSNNQIDETLLISSSESEDYLFLKVFKKMNHDEMKLFIELLKILHDERKNSGN